MRIENCFVLMAIILLLLFVCGQQGCEMPGQGGTEAQKTGIDYSLASGVDYLNAGKILQQGETFYVGVHIENYDKNARTGQVCIRDNVADNYGGISSSGDGECQFFNIRAADIVKKETQTFTGKKIVEQITPGVSDIYFPQDNQYVYSGLPILMQAYNGQIVTSLRYRQTGQATATLTVPDPQQPSISQEPAPIMISVTKSVHKQQEGYKVDLEILLKKNPAMKIYSPDFTKENTTYFNAEISPQTMSCVDSSGLPVQNLVTIENEKLIKCSSIIYMTGSASQSYPLVITLDYGVAIEKVYPFGIETKIK